MRPIARHLTVLGLLVALGGCQASYPEFNPNDYRTGLHDYSAGQAALISRDTNTAANHYLAALNHDPDNSYIRGRAFELLVSNGRFEEARAIDTDLPPGRAAFGISRMLKVVDAVSSEDYKAAEQALDEAQGTGFDGLVKPVTRAWIAAGQGDKVAALEALQPLMTRPAALAQFAREHRAMILGYLGDWENADRAYQEAIDLSGRTSSRVVLDYAARLAERGDRSGAIAVLKPLSQAENADLHLSKAVERLEKGKKIKVLSRSPATGISEALYRIATEMANRTTASTAILYSRLAGELNPSFNEAYYLIGEILAAQELHLDALRAFERVEKEMPRWLYAQLRIANLMARMEQADGGIVLMKALLADHPDFALGHITLGDLYRGQEDYDAAIDAYTAAVLLQDEEGREDWFLYYARGVTFERSDRWPQAEADFKKALDINPNEPSVLNYLGYSWIDRGMNYEEGRAMIEKAVEQRPNDGFIIDSLGWALYLSGDYERAVDLLEQAVALQPGDATINDHLGDAYWKVGRRIEARFKWKHALDLDADEALIAKVHEKLDLGLDVVDVTDAQTTH